MTADLVEPRETTTVLLNKVDLEPECGVDFCDRCGDCLACYGDDTCRHGGQHRWVIYTDDHDPRVTL